MNLDAFKASLLADQPPQGLTSVLSALWWVKKGDWEQAHSMTQADHSREGAWVHAHLHHVEGDAGNARYWYSRAGRGEPHSTVTEERAALVSALLDRV